MKVIRAKSAGFCWGVERAINIARSYATKGKHPIYTDGPLIHNRQMMEKMEAEGIREVGDYQSGSDVNVTNEEGDDPILVVRAHGVSPKRRKYLRNLGLPFRDATCPDVGNAAGKILKHSRKGYSTVIFGDKNHPEVIGLMGYTDGRGYPVQTKEDIDALPDLGELVVMVSQTTMFTDEFEKLADYLRQKYPNLVAVDTICGATKARQGDVPKLVEAGAQAIVVIGGHHSANTRKLALLAQRSGLPTYHIETIKDLDVDAIKDLDTVGVTAGASTPNFVIDEVCEALEAL